jgi:hypothetical protein
MAALVSGVSGMDVMLPGAKTGGLPPG